MTQNFERLFQPELQRGEKILWSGQPIANKFFTGSDIFMIPLSFLWGGFAIFWELSALTIPAKGSSGGPGLFSIIFPLWGIPFVLMGLYMIFGRFIYKYYNKKNTWYAVTSQRLLIVKQLFGPHRVDAYWLNQLPTLSKTSSSDGSGTIIFAPPLLPKYEIYQNTGMDFMNIMGGGSGAFFDIPDVNRVCELIRDTQSVQQETSTP